MILEKVLETTKYVVERSREVKINKEKIVEVARKVGKEKVPHLEEKYYFIGGPEETVQYFLVLDSLNFCFFAEKGQEKWGIEDGLRGFFSLALALKRAVKKYPLLDAQYLCIIPFEDFSEILRGNVEIPLLEKRWQILQETGKTLLEKFDGQAVNIIKKAERSAQKLVEIIFENFPSFRDVAKLEGKKIYFLKRAQIFAGDIYGVFSGRGFGNFSDIHKLTAFADYRVPQILNNLGVSEYSPQLLQKIEKQELFPAFSQEEMEIRANTIWAVEKIKKALAKQGINRKSFEIDWDLWIMAKKEKLAMPHHCTRTIFY